jgi:hypothetical protein
VALARLASDSLELIEARLADGGRLRASDVSWLQPLSEGLGTPSVTLSDPSDITRSVTLDARLDLETINAHAPAALQTLADTLRAMLAATAYRPQMKAFGGYEIPVHNAEIARALQGRYSPGSFQKLFQLADAHDVFHIAIDEATGIGKTTEIAESEDDIMSQMWVTDAIRFREIQNARYPELRQKALETLARFYRNERGAFDEAYANPAGYRDRNSKVGVHHIFMPGTLTAFPWLLPKRLESHGLALADFSRTIVAGGVQHAPWGIAEPSDDLLEAIARLVKYFDAIDYSTAPSNGVWEELSAKEGLTSDIALVRDGLVAFKELAFNPDYATVPSIQRARAYFRASPYADLLTDERRIDALIEQGTRVVRARMTGAVPTENPDRNADSGLVFAVSLNTPLSDDPVANARAYLRVLDSLERSLVRPNGMVKYAPFQVLTSDGKKHLTYDSYLAPNWGLLADGEGHLSLHKLRFEETFGYPITHVEPSHEDRFLTRSRYAAPDKPAEWTFVLSEMARAYAVQLGALLDAVEVPGHTLTPEERALLDTLEAKTTEYVNRSYAQITGTDVNGQALIKANGRPARNWAVPEAYQHVSTFRFVKGGSGARETALLPGVNTPLGWSTATLFAVSKLFGDDLGRLHDLRAVHWS